MIYTCCDKRRRDAVAADPTLNGIDYLEVIDSDLSDTDPLRQRTLLVHCLKPLPTGPYDDKVRIEGGERIKNISVDWAASATPEPAPLSAPGEADTAAIVAALLDAASVLVVRVSEAGDFSTYTLRLVASALSNLPLANFDPPLAAIDFGFKVDCPSDFDCAPVAICPPQPVTPPEINYLAKDYATFRRLLLDRMAQLVPNWAQTSEADYGIALVELLAYVGDQLSYQQDAIATEAYLGTARRRISLRRHAVLVDYPMHDGCNARAWLQLQLSAPSLTLAKTTQFLTRCPGFPVGIASGSAKLEDAMLLTPLVFEPVFESLETPTLHAAHNQMSFYTWSDQRCCLIQGATSATLAGAFPELKQGDTLLFEEVMGPLSGKLGDADAGHRHVVRLTTAGPPSKDLLTGADVTEVAWGKDDALPFTLCISSITDEAHGSQMLTDVSVARGNLVLVDHGQTIAAESLGVMPEPTLFLAPSCSADHCAPPAPVPIPVRFRPTLAQGPLTQAATVTLPSASGGTPIVLPFDPNAAAVDAMDWDMRGVNPQLTLTSTLNADTKTWQPQRTLLNSADTATDFVIEVDDDGLAHLRFGDSSHGMRPATGTAFSAGYRIGNGTAGNAGAESIVHIVASGADIAAVTGVRNPLPAAGGVDPEAEADVRRNAPQAFRTQERAVTPEDYAAVSERYAGVSRAAATLRWTGSWYTVFITIDPEAGIDSVPLKAGLADFVDAYRMAGHDLEFNDPVYVPLEIDMHVCVAPDYFRSDVKAELLDVFSNRLLPDGRKGIFYPDNFTFGQTVYLSPLYATAHSVPGVQSVQITTFQRQGIDDSSYLAAGEFPLSRLQIAVLDNDPNFPERGVIKLDLNGGK